MAINHPSGIEAPSASKESYPCRERGGARLALKRLVAGLTVVVSGLSVTGCDDNIEPELAPTPEYVPTRVYTPAPAEPETLPPEDMHIHVVEPGDTLTTIADKYDVDINRIIELNNIGDPNLLAINQELTIPIPPIEVPQSTLEHGPDTFAKGIDVSEYQGEIDWSVTSRYVDFAIIRLGDAYNRNEDGEFQIDEQFESNMQACEEYGVDNGVYFFTRASNEEGAAKEAQFVLGNIAGHKLEYPVYFDMELDSHKKMTGQELRNLIDAFAKPLEEAGYYIGVYGNENFSNYLSEKDPTIFDEYDFWIANYGSNRSEQYDQVEPRDISQIGSGLGSAGMAQVTDRARISGIDGSVDVNFSYKNYPKIMKDAMKNNH